MSQDCVPQVHVIPQSEWSMYRTIRLQALTESPDAFGSTLEAETAQPLTHWQDSLAAAVASRIDLPLFAVIDMRVIGLAWAKLDAHDPTTSHLFQMWIDPAARGQGAGAALVAQSVKWAQALRARVMRLGVACGDNAAARLYLRAGFVPVGSPTPLRAGSQVFMQTMELKIAG